MRVLAPAKINLYLRVGRARADGFHPVVTWMTTVGLFDILTIDRAGGRGVAFTCDMPGVPCDAGNLVMKAVAALRGSSAELESSIAEAERGLVIHLEKGIPFGAGLGGGSSDAARALEALNRLWRLRLTAEELAALSVDLGSDVAFFLDSPSAICRGRGELVESISPPQCRFALLLLPRVELPTPLVYRRFDELRLGCDMASQLEPPWQEWTLLSAQALLERLVNDLEPAAMAIAPELGDLRAGAERVIGRSVRMSGSGSSLFSLFDSRAEAVEASLIVTERLGVEAVAVEIAPAVSDDLST